MNFTDDYTEQDYRRDLEAMARYEDEQQRRDSRVLRKQKRKLSPFLFSQLKWIIEFHETTWHYEIVQELGKNASKEEDTFHKLRHLYTDCAYQSYDSGETSCGGTIWVPIRNGNYFKFAFGM